MPALERLLAVRLGWILIRFGVVVSLALSLALPAASALKGGDLGAVEDSQAEPEKGKEAEPQDACVLPAEPITGLVVALTQAHALVSVGVDGPNPRRRPYHARGPPAV